MEEKSKSKITLTYLNGTGYVFNADDYMKLRTEHRVVGSLVGTSSSHGWAASSNGLPAEFSLYEIQLLVEKGFVVLLSKADSLLREPTETELQAYSEECDERNQDQEKHLKDKKVKDSLNYIDKIMHGKRKKLLSSGVPENDIKLSKEDVIQEIKDSVSCENKDFLFEIHCEHPRVHEAVPVHLSMNGTVKYRVFKDFWERGKFVTCGEAFGADFIVYPGDPIMFHASHIIIVLSSTIVKPLDFIAKARLSVIVNKLCVFAYLDKDNRLSYQTVQWEGNKDGNTQ